MHSQQRTPAWFNARKGKLTASNFGAAAGVNPYVSRRKALREAIEPKPFPRIPPEACQHGIRSEPLAVKDYMVRTGNIVRNHGLAVHPEIPWLGGSPDGLVGDRGMIEVKCPIKCMVPHKKIPPYYYCQINGPMETFDRDWCDFVSWTPTEMKIYRVYRDQLLWSYLLERYTIFFACMQRGCANIPNMAKRDKEAIVAAIAESDANTDYGFWTGMEPNGVWTSPPHDPFSESEEESSSKDLIKDGTDEIRLLPDAKRQHTGLETACGGELHSATTPTLSRQCGETAA